MRVDDDSPERVQQELRARDRQTQEAADKRRTSEASAFDLAMATRKAVASSSSGQRASSALARAPHDPRKQGQATARSAGRSRATSQQQGQSAKAARRTAQRAGDAGQTQAQRQVHIADDQHDDHQGAARTSDERLGARSSSDRKASAQRDESGASAASARSGGRPEAERTDADAQGGRGGQGDQQPPAFRVPNSALLAPPPLAVPRASRGADALRQLAQEIAKQIVESARVGINRLGLPEMQIELKSEVLQGLKVKVAGRHGRVRAVFSSADPKVAAQLREGLGTLRESLSARGLHVEALEIEEER